jgi:2-phospho-L-lactate guanylyltransferase
MAGKTSPHALPASTWAIVPVKPLRESKSRLANVLTVVQRVDLMATILQRTLRVLSRAQSIDRILVVSADPIVLSMAGERGAMTLDEPGATGR